MAILQMEFRRLDIEYREQLEQLKPRLPDAWPFFEAVSLHDGTLLALRVGDDIDKRFPTYSTLVVNKRCVSVELEVLNHEETRYADRATSPIDDWMFDELTSVNDLVLRHEVQFGSGATLLIDFEKIDVRSAAIEGREGLPYIEES